jgi:Rap1a immunity proteins
MFRSQLTLTLGGVVLIATLMLCLQGVALAEQNPYSATYVMPGCRAFMKGGSLNSFKQGWCSGLITGLAQMHRRCMPPQLTQRQLARGIVQYVNAHPARMHEDFRILAAEAMQAAWPCKRHKYRGRPRPMAASDVGVSEHQVAGGKSETNCGRRFSVGCVSWVKTVQIHERYADGVLDRLPGLARELVVLKVDVIVAVSVAASTSALEATTEIPIVMVHAGNPKGGSE